MNRNTEVHFSKIPRIKLPRSKFDESFSLSTTFNNGELIPLFTDIDITPGDTVKLNLGSLVRLATQIYPVMGNMFLDIYAFFVPHRLTWEHWENLWGQNDDPWIQVNDYSVPQIEAPEGGWAAYTLADYMGIPTYVEGYSVSCFGFRSYCKIWNDFFRNENTQSNLHMYIDDTDRTGANTGDAVLNTELGAKPAKAARIHDYFSSCLPSPQRGPAVSIPLGSKAPVFTQPENHTSGMYPSGMNDLQWVDGTNTPLQSGALYSATYGDYKGITVIDTDSTLPTNRRSAIPANLYADLSQATAASINALRAAFALQKFFEAQGRYGTRYIEVIKGIFSTESSDARLQRAEYLGGDRIPLNIQQIIQTSSTDETSPMGNAAGFSLTRGYSHIFTKSFEEHGTLMVLGVTRIRRSYQQGLNRMWSRKKVEDFYNPFFANLGEQAVLNKEIYLQSPAEGETDPNPENEEVFGYQERFAEMRYKNNMVTGAMRSNTPGGGLDAWHWADNYSELPKLSSGWMEESKTEIDRTIAVTSERANQIKADFFFDLKYTRMMPIYGIPGLIDHV